MKDFLDPILKDRKKLIVIAGAVVVVLLVVIVLLVVMSGGEGGGDEIEFEFEPEPAEPQVSVEEQVSATLTAVAPTPTLEPTVDVPATLAWEAEATREAVLEQTSAIQQPGLPTRVPHSLGPADIRYLDALGRPVWLSVQSYFLLSDIYEQLPADYLVIANHPRIQSIQSTTRRAVTLMEETSQYQPDVSGPVRQYGIYVEETILKVRDAAAEAAVMFAEVELGEESYDDLSRQRRDEFNQMHFRVAELLEEFERDMERFGCSACGELFRGR